MGRPGFRPLRFDPAAPPAQGLCGPPLHCSPHLTGSAGTPGASFRGTDTCTAGSGDLVSSCELSPIRIQRLERLAALCPACHEVKHAGRASKQGRLPAVIARLAAVNGWSPDDADLYLKAVFVMWAARSRHQWTLDLSLLSTRYGIDGAD